MSETELQAEIKRLKNESMQMIQQMRMLESGYFNVGGTFAGVCRELLLAIGDPSDTDAMERAKKHAKECLKHWDIGIEMKQKADAERNNLVQLPPKEIITAS